MIQFYPNDVVRCKSTGCLEIIECRHGNDVYKFINDPGRWDVTLLTLIRRADEEPWPADVPRCELPLPEGDRYAFTGYQHWSSPSQLFYWNGKWSISHGPVAGDPKLPTCKAVNDEDYVPPQLSETTNSSQVESKVTKEIAVRRMRHADLPKQYIVIEEEEIAIIGMDRARLDPASALCLAELLTAAAKEAQQ